LKRLYGSVWLKDGLWHLTGDPHVLMQLKRIFARIWAGEHGTVTFQDGDEMRRKIGWFLLLYPMKISPVDQKAIAEGSKRHDETILRMDELIDTKYVSRSYKMALPAREYQKVAAEMALDLKGLLIADDLGTGKTISALAMLTEKATLPAVVVTLSGTMPTQWRDQTWKFLPDLHTHVVKKGTPYPLPKRNGRGPDLVIINYHKLNGWAETLGAYAKCIIFDEIQELRRRESLKYSAAEHIAQQMKYKCGLSVGPDSMILVRDESGTRYLRIDDFAESVGAMDGIFVPVSGVQVRSFNGTEFCWKKLKAVLRHSSVGTKTFRIHTEKGRSLVLTEDHSIYRVRANGHRWVHAVKKPIMAMDLVRGRDLIEGDEVLLEDYVREDKPLRTLDIVDYITASRWFVNGDFSDWIEANVTLENGYSGAGGVRRRQIVVGHRGTYVTGAQYIGSTELRGRPGRIYTQGKGGIWTSPRIPVEDAAYILGFYLGDGWVDRSRICFAIQNEGVRRFLKKAAPFFKWAKCNIAIRTMPGKSVEVRFSSLILANFITGFYRNAKSFEKQIPDEAFSFSYEDTRTFIKGLLDSDGNFSLRKTNKAWFYTTTSKDLADGLVELLKKVDVVAGISKCEITGQGGIIRGRKIVSRRPKYQVFFSHYEWMHCNSGRYGRRQRYAPGKVSGYPARIKRIVPEEAQTVYDLSVDGHEWPSFVASGILVHNSATPIFNLGGEIWNVMNVLRPDALGTWEEFLREWCYGEQAGVRKSPAVKDPKALGFYLKTEHLMLRRTRKDVGRELPALTKIVQPVESDEKAFDEIEDKAAELARIILSTEKIGNWDRMRAHEEFDNKMRQATGTSKAPYVADFIRLLVEADDEPVLVFGWHRAVYDILQAKLKDLKPEMFTGSETAAHKEASLKNFIAGRTKILLMSLRAGQGLDGIQHCCRTVVFGELDWSPAVMDQDVGRVLRDGQPDPVTAFYLVSESGSDPIIAETLGLKQAQLEGIRDPERGIIAELQTDKNRIRELARHYLDRSSKTSATKVRSQS
jgi:intein/homing endonuclease/superfamily II DNA or RNA helicase